MFRPALMVVLVPLLLSGTACIQSVDTKSGGPAIVEVAVPAKSPAAEGSQAASEAEQRPASQAGVLRFRVPPMRLVPLHRVESAGPDGVLRLAVSLSEEEAAQFQRSGMPLDFWFNLVEGYYLGLVGLSPKWHVMSSALPSAVAGLKVCRIRVTEVQAAGKAVVQAGTQAARELQPGATILLVRPAGATTAELQAAPDILPLMDEKGQSPQTDPATLARLSQSTNNLKQIGLAMHNFHDVYKQLPPAVIYGPDGKPWHSWRVLILPFVEQLPLYQQYRFDEPWDGPNNRKLLDKMPPVYRDPIYEDAGGHFTHYAAATGPGTAFPNEKRIPSQPPRRDRPAEAVADLALGANRLANFTDGTSNSLLVGPIGPERKIPWMKPEDVVVDEKLPGLGQPGGFAAPYRIGDKAGGVFLWADGSVRTIRTDIEAQTLQNLLHIADGQPIGSIPSLDATGPSGPPRMPVIEIRSGASGPTARLVFEDLERPGQRIPVVRAVPAVPPVATKTPPYPSTAPAPTKQKAKPYAPAAARTSDPFAAEIPPAAPPAVNMPVYVAPLAVAPAPTQSYEDVVAEVRKQGGRFLAKGFRSSWSPDGRRLAFGKRAGNPPGALAIVELEGGKITEIVDEGKDPAWSGKDGGLIAYVTGDAAEEQVWLIEPSGKNRRKVADGGFSSLSADGKTLFFHSRRTNQLMAVDPTAAEPSAAAKPLAAVPFWYPAVSPDGKRVAYRLGSQLVIAELDPGKAVKRYGPLAGWGFVGGWSPDGKQLGLGGYGSDAGLILLDCQTERAVQFASRWLTAPAWSPDGLKVSFDIRGPAGWEIWMIDAKALAQAKPAALIRDRYSLPPGGVTELAAFLKEAHAFDPTTPQEKADRESRGRIAMTTAAQRILQLESDHTTPASQLALLVLLEDRVRRIAFGGAPEQRQIVHLLKMYLDAETEIELARQAAQLALEAAKTLETRDRELAAEIYRDFAPRIASRKDAKLAEIAKAMEDAGRRLTGSKPPAKE